MEAVKESSGGGEWRVAGGDYDCPVTARQGLGVDTDTDQPDLTWDWDGTTDNLHGSLHTLVSRGEQMADLWLGEISTF